MSSSKQLKIKKKQTIPNVGKIANARKSQLLVGMKNATSTLEGSFLVSCKYKCSLNIQFNNSAPICLTKSFENMPTQKPASKIL